jgi:hypothetical protein
MSTSRRLDFILLEDFLRLNPHYDEKTRAEVLTLDTAKAPLNDRTLGPLDPSQYESLASNHYLDATEIQSFFKQNPQLNYENFIGESQTGWRWDLSRYLLDRAALDITVPVFDRTGFPIAEGESLTDDPTHNLELVLDYYEHLISGVDLTNELALESLAALFSKGPLVFSGEHQEAKDGSGKKLVLDLSPRPNPLFWRLIDPKGQHPELPERLVSALSRALQTLSTQSGSPFSAIGRPKFPPEKFPDVFLLLRQEWQTTTPAQQVLSVPPASFFTASVAELGLLLAEKDRKNFESLISDPAIFSYDEHLSPSLSTTILSFFPNRQAGLSLPQFYGFLHLDDQPTDLSLHELIAANGYAHVRFLDADGSHSTYVRTTQTLTMTSAHTGTPNVTTLRTAPLTQDQAQDWFSMVEGTDSFMNGFAQLPWALEHSYLDHARRQQSWLEPLFKQLPADTIVKDMTDFCEAYMAAYSLYGLTTLYDYGTESLTLVDADNGRSAGLLALVTAIRAQENPLAGLALALLLASHESAIGDEMRLALPGLLSLISLDITEGRDMKGGIEIIIDEDAAGNAWHTWTQADFTLAAQKLAAADPAQLQHSLKSMTLTNLEDLAPYANLFSAQVNTVCTAGDFNTPEATRKNNPGRIDRQRLERRLRLDSTRDKVAALDPKQTGEVTLEPLLFLKLSAAEREDLKRALKPMLSGPFSPLDEASWSPKPGQFIGGKFATPQLELLSPRALETFIRDGAIYFRDDLWRALFNADPARGLALWQSALKAVAKENEDTPIAVSESTSFSIGTRFPSADDVACGFVLAAASGHPELKNIVIAHEALLRSITSDELLVDVVMGKTDLLGLQIGRLNHEMKAKGVLTETDRWQHAVAINQIVHATLPLYGKPNAERVRVLASGFLSQELITSILLRNGLLPDITPEQRLAAFDGLMSFSPRLNEDILLGGKIRIISNNEIQSKAEIAVWLWELGAGIWDEAHLQTYIQFLVETITDREMDFSKMSGVTQAMATDPAWRDKILPKEIYALAACCGEAWGFAHLQKDDWLTSDGHQTLFMPKEPVLTVFRGFLSTRTRHTGTRVDDDVRRFFTELAKVNGPFVQGPNFYFLTVEFELAAFSGLGPYPPLSSTALDYLLKEGYKTPENMVVLRTLRHLRETGLLALNASTSSESLDALIFPELTLASTFSTMMRFDEIDYPKTAEEFDSTGFTLEEGDDYRELILRHYKKFAVRLARVIQLRQAGEDIMAVTQELKDLADSVEAASPWLQYAAVLVQALDNDPAAIGTLWDFQEGRQTLESDLDIFKQVSKQLLTVGRQILLLLDPDRFFMGVNPSKLLPAGEMSQIELSLPDPALPVLQGHLANPEPLDPSADPSDAHHAMMVAQTLLGNPANAAEASGTLRAYALKLDEKIDQLWPQIADRLEGAARDAQAGITLSVVNISLGWSGAPALGREWEAFLNSPEAKRIRAAIDALTAKKIPVVIAAGNSGDDERTDTSLNFLIELNRLATFDSRLIVVGATQLASIGGASSSTIFACRSPSEADDESIDDRLFLQQLSEFSSGGNSYARPDLIAPGEGFRFWNSEDKLDVDVAGTSFASPFTARLIALMKTTNPSLSVEAIQAILKKSARDLETETPGLEGAGLVDPRAALYIAYAMRPFTGKKANAAFAQTLGLPEAQQTALDWLARHITMQVTFTDTSRQAYGE